MGPHPIDDTLRDDAHGEANPFHIPADEEIFRYREEERLAKTQTRLIAISASVVDKSTFASRMQATATDDARGTLQEMRPGKTAKGELTLAAASSGAVERRKEKENMADLIAKKREIFLLQMSLDTKRAEIKKLVERARQREEALKKSEQMLEEDALRFDAFLKENDEKVQEAIKRAEMEAKAKQDKLLEIKRLNTAIAALRSEMNKYEEQLEDCRKYKDFLDAITPSEWFETQAHKLQLRKDAMTAEWVAECAAVKARKEAALVAKAQAESDYTNARTQQQAERAERAITNTIAQLKEAMREKEPPAPDLSFEVQPDEEEMFFHDPAQLLAVYQQLEESNLFYIQNAQETEEALEELRAKYRDTKLAMDAEAAGLASVINGLQGTIEAAADKSSRLKARTLENMGDLMLSMGNAGGGGGSGAISLDALSSKVAEVYVRCGFDADASIGTLQMLTNIESKLEEYLNVVDGMPPDFVETTEKAREKDRRKVARDEKLATQQKEHEARMARALERAAAPVFRKVGKPLMFRSQPLKKREVVQADNGDNDEQELQAYLARDLL